MRQASMVGVCLLWTLAGLTAATEADAADYSPIDLGIDSSRAHAINNSGQVVGWRSGPERAFIWEDGTTTTLPTLGGNTWANSINNLGTVVGVSFSTGSSSSGRAFEWNSGDPMKNLGTFLGGSTSQAYDINDLRQVVGSARPPAASGELDHAAIWEVDERSEITDIGTLGGRQSFAYGINNLGQVVGQSMTSTGGWKPFLWTAWTGISELDFGESDVYGSSARDINDSGQVVGWSRDENGHIVACLWSVDVGVAYLGTDSAANAINNEGEIVGWVSDPGGAMRSAILWYEGTSTVLNPLPGDNYGEAYGINDLGQIVGVSSLIDESGFTSQERAVLWNPIPGPLRVGEAKLIGDGTLVRIDSPIVSAAWDDVFYIEEDDRSSGIRVESVAHGFTEGDAVYVKGYLRTNPHDERYIEPVSITPMGSGGVAPLGMNNKWLGGGDFFYDAGPPISGQRGITGASGLNNIGLLVKTWGEVTYVGADYFTIDDGSDVNVKCLVPAGVTLPNLGDVSVTGISSCEKGHAELHRVLRIRDQNDITQPPPTL